MRSFGNLVINEWLKMFKKKSFFVPFILVAGMILFTGSMMDGNTGSDFGFADIAIYSRGMGQFLTMISIIVTAGTVAREHSLGTIKLLLIRSQSRSKILASKYVAIVLYVTILTLFALIVGLVTETFMMGTVDGISRILNSLMIAALSMIYTLMYVTITFTLGILLKSTGAAIGIGMCMFFSEKIIAMLLVKYSWAKYLPFFNLDLVPYIFDKEYAPIPGMTAMFSVIILFAYLLLFLAISFVTFKKRDVA
ncbi:ABC transporter permease [Paenibacillus faecalis]|uniref:ABC transporter permease n=1 Tax=Paenibacillus faecalis TaxID=2079532 RepID=UPI000D104894|nr:DUF2705 family protein [Paenibacillus faecalis]